MRVCVSSHANMQWHFKDSFGRFIELMDFDQSTHISAAPSKNNCLISIFIGKTPFAIKSDILIVVIWEDWGRKWCFYGDNYYGIRRPVNAMEEFWFFFSSFILERTIKKRPSEKSKSAIVRFDPTIKTAFASDKTLSGKEIDESIGIVFISFQMEVNKNKHLAKKESFENVNGSLNKQLLGFWFVLNIHLNLIWLQFS